MLRALGKLARAETEKIQTYDYALGPLIMPFIEEQEDPVLLRAAIPCFPFIRHSNTALFQATSRRIFQLSTYSVRTVAATAVGVFRELRGVLLFCLI
jgi:hypothetical protein